MQRVLSFTYNKRKYVSKTWDFEALVRVQEIHVSGETNSIGRIGSSAVDYLFENTDATQDILDANPAEKMKMCRQVFDWYMSDMEELARKNETVPDEEKSEP